MRALFLGLIRVYQGIVSPWVPRHCRYEPTCSSYAHEAISRYGAVRGVLMAAKRIFRCHPGSPGGADPVGARP